MTVAAVILAASAASALADADGTPAARRLADAAWAGGATPVVVCAPDPDGTIATALANAEVTLVEAVATERGPVGEIANGIDAALRLLTGTDAVLVWPARLAWVDAETVTTLIEAHGGDRGSILRPGFGGKAGFPALVPVAHLAALRTLSPTRTPEELLDDLAGTGVQVRMVETGDPGVIHDVSHSLAQLPSYDGPPEPADGLTREWGAVTADEPDDAPVPGPGRLVPPEAAG